MTGGLKVKAHLIVESLFPGLLTNVLSAREGSYRNHHSFISQISLFSTTQCHWALINTSSWSPDSGHLWKIVHYAEWFVVIKLSGYITDVVMRLYWIQSLMGSLVLFQVKWELLLLKTGKQLCPQRPICTPALQSVSSERSDLSAHHSIF